MTRRASPVTLHTDLFEVDVLAGGVIVVVLDADVAGFGARAAFRLEFFSARRHGPGGVEIGDRNVVQADL